MKNKLLISFILFVIILSFFTCSFASTDKNVIYFNNPYNNKEITVYLPMNYGIDYNKYAVFVTDDGSFINYMFIFSDSNIYFGPTEGNPNNVFTNKSGNDFYYYTISNSHISSYITEFDFSDKLITDSLFSSSKGFSSSRFNSKYVGDGFSIVLSANHSIYTNNNESDLVFQEAPSTQVTIPGITQVEEIPQVMEQVLRILLPIGLIVFSIGLVIFLTRLVISRLT